MNVESNGIVPARIRVTRLDENGQPDGSSSGAVVSTVSGCRFMEGQTADVVIVDDPDATARNELRITYETAPIDLRAHYQTVQFGGPMSNPFRVDRFELDDDGPPIHPPLVTPGGRPDWRRWLDDEDTDDTEAYDDQPDLCWRCDSAQGSTDVGLCEGCLVDLVAERPPEDRVVLTDGYWGLSAVDLFIEHWQGIATAIRESVIPAMVTLSASLADLNPKLLEFLTGQSVSDGRRQHAHYARRAGRPRTGKRTRRGR